MISYRKLWEHPMIKCCGRIYLLRVISSPTLAKLGKDRNVDITTIDKICSLLRCQPSDIMEWIP